MWFECGLGRGGCGLGRCVFGVGVVWESLYLVWVWFWEVLTLGVDLHFSIKLCAEVKKKIAVYLSIFAYADLVLRQ